MNRFLLAVIVVMYVGAFAKLSKAHDWYSDKKTGWGVSCCSGDHKTGDCKPVTAWTTPEGKWQFRYTNNSGKTRIYEVPEEAMRPDEENPEPFQASGCVYNGHVMCFWKSKIGG